jgi:hypothetical protein
MTEGKGEIVIYNELEGRPQIEVKLEGKTLWLSQKLIADLFEKDSDTIGTHIKNIYAEGELEEAGTTSAFSVTQQEGKRKIKRDVKFYNLDVILSVGYRVSSKRGTAFRKWANDILGDYLTKGYAHNEKLLHEKLSPTATNVSLLFSSSDFLRKTEFSIRRMERISSPTMHSWH